MKVRYDETYDEESGEEESLFWVEENETGNKIMSMEKETPRKDWDIREGEFEFNFKPGGILNITLKDFYIKDGMWIIQYQNGNVEYRPENSLKYIGKKNEEEKLWADDFYNYQNTQGKTKG